MAELAPGPKGKSKLSYSGFDYIFQTKRKDGSETWRCSFRDCEARILKKTLGEKDVLQMLKDHSIEMELSRSAAVHLTLKCMKERAKSHPEEAVSDVMKQAVETAKEFIIASLPSPSAIEGLIQSWRAEGDAESKQRKTPRRPRRRRSVANKENSATPEMEKSRKTSGKIKLPGVKRAKLMEMAAAGDSPRMAQKKRGRGKSYVESEDEDEDEDEDEIGRELAETDEGDEDDD